MLRELKQAKESLESILGKDRVAFDPANRLLYSMDMMSGLKLERKAGAPPHLPDLICWPESTGEVSKILKIAHRHKVPVVPFGGGSGVSGGTVPLFGGIMLDLKRMNRIEKIEERRGQFYLTAQTGILGEHLERELNTRGYTLGHFPSSILCATLGGYLAARSAGQLSSKYGKIEDMVDEIETVLPNGRVIPFGGSVKEFPKIRPNDLFVGAEGCLGVITRSRLKVFPLAPTTRYRGMSFNRLEDALKAIREIMQSGLRPAVVRLYDPLDSLLLQHGYQKSSEGGRLDSWLKPLLEKIPKEAIKRKTHQILFSHPYWIQRAINLIPPDVILILGFEGDAELAAAQERAALAICRRSICRDLGERPGLHWLKHRYSVSFKMPQIFEQEAFVDTIEVAATWDNLMNLYRKIRGILTKKVLLLAHFSHAYPEGCSIYFTVVGRTGSPEKDRAAYYDLWNEAMEACLAVGATISHHHGIGLLKAKFLPRELGGAMDFYRRIKKRLDPRNIMNPGKMGL